MEACWANNLKVRGSKPRSAKNFLFFSSLFSLDLVLSVLYFCSFSFVCFVFLLFSVVFLLNFLCRIN